MRGIKERRYVRVLKMDYARDKREMICKSLEDGLMRGIKERRYVRVLKMDLCEG